MRRCNMKSWRNFYVQKINLIWLLVSIATKSYIYASSPKLCMLPENSDKQYQVECDGNANFQKRIINSGKVPNSCAVSIKCKRGYQTEFSDQSKSICYQGDWFPQIPQCKKICRKLESSFLNLSLKCYKGGKEISCEQTLFSGTTVKPTCKTHYHPEYPVAFSEIECEQNGDWNHNLYSCLPDCGKQFNKLDPQIVGGVEEEVGSSPWHVAIYNKTTNTLICGGTLISTRLVISAAHCFQNTKKLVLYEPKYYEVVVAKISRNLNIADNAFQRSYQIAEIRVPEHFRGVDTNYACDIAILILYENVQLSNVILPVCLEPPRGNLELNNGFLGKVSGWGNDGTDKPSKVLLTTDLPFMKYTTCLNLFRQEDRQSITDDKFCAGNVTGSRVSKGDSGGGFIFFHPHYHLHYLRGVVSVKLSKETSVTIFTDIVAYLDWIHSTLKEIRNEDAGLTILGASCTTANLETGTCKHYAECSLFTQLLQSQDSSAPSFSKSVGENLCDSKKNQHIICCPKANDDEDIITFSSFSQCGKSSRLPVGIIYIEHANLGYWPWTVIFVKGDKKPSNDYNSILCIGSLVSDRWVLTSGTCALRMKNQRVYAHIGDAIADDRQEKSSAIEILVNRMILHPGFVKFENLNNIALVRLSAAVNFTEFIRPVCVLGAVEYKTFESYFQKPGYTFEYLTPKEFFAKTNKILTTDECYETSNATNQFIPEIEFCVNHCSAKDGSPLLIPVPSTNTYFLVGIYSYNYGVCEYASSVSIYTKVSEYSEWINEKTRQER